MTTRPDYTRWNRAGLTRMDYVGGNAAVWLEELRVALTSTYAREAAKKDREIAMLRDLFLDETPKFQRDLIASEALRDAVPWDRLRDAIPAPLSAPDPDTGETHKLETRGQRSARLMGQYDAPVDDNQAWEVMRAFARALHVASGHLNAHVNEGYLRTATQWDSLRRLAAMVNYQPTPAASASTIVGLDVKPGLGPVEVPAGLAMKYQPKSGQPLIFETLEKFNAHPALNAARLKGWNVNRTLLPEGAQNVTWIAGEKDELDPGMITILANDQVDGARIITAVARDEDAGTAVLAFQDDNEPVLEKARIKRRLQFRDNKLATHTTRLWFDPDDVVTGMHRPETGRGKPLILENPGSIQKGDLIRLIYQDVPYVLPVKERRGSYIVIETRLDLEDGFELYQLTPTSTVEDGKFQIMDPDNYTVFYASGDRINAAAGFPDTNQNPEGHRINYRRNRWRGSRTPTVLLDGTQGVSVTAVYSDYINNNEGEHIANRIPVPTGVERGYVLDPETKPTVGKLLKTKAVLDGPPERIVTFEGKPPKSLKAGLWYALQREERKTPLVAQVVAISFEKDFYFVLFDRSVPVPHATEFVGPMKRSIRPLGYDRDPRPIGDTDDIILEGLPDEAVNILRPGRSLIICDTDRDGSTSDVQATLNKIEPRSDGSTKIEINTSGEINGFVRGDTVIKLNATTITHGESKGPKALGSGDGEVPRQSFVLQVSDISHVPSATSETGVIPAIDVTVDGEIWSYSDFVDPEADGTKTWSSTLGEDGYLRLHFRRRLPTGTNNVEILRHRVGTGLRGTGIPARSFEKPMKKNPLVDAVHQPFATTGGADREPVSSVRTAAPSRLSSNGRAVSLQDFERLAARHASIWRARATEVATGTRSRRVELTVLPAGGAPLPKGGSTLEDDLREAILSRALPGVRLSFDSFESVPLLIGAKVRADIESYDKVEIKAACEAAIRAVFNLEFRDFGQPAYVSEILAALETVAGVATATVHQFNYDGTRLSEPPNTVERDGMFSTIFPRRKQIAHVGPISETESNPIEIEVGGLT